MSEKKFPVGDAYVYTLMWDRMALKKECKRLVMTDSLFVYQYQETLCIYVREDLLL